MIREPAHEEPRGSPFLQLPEGRPGIHQEEALRTLQVRVRVLQVAPVGKLPETGAEPGTPGVGQLPPGDFLGEMRFPGEVETGTLVLRVGRTSFTLGQGLFKDGECVGTSQAVMVLVDAVTRRPKPLPAGALALLERFLEAPASA